MLSADNVLGVDAFGLLAVNGTSLGSDGVVSVVVLDEVRVVAVHLGAIREGGGARLSSLADLHGYRFDQSVLSNFGQRSMIHTPHREKAKKRPCVASSVDRDRSVVSSVHRSHCPIRPI